MQLPESLIHSLHHIPGFNKEAFEAVHQSGEQVTSIRCNPQKISHSQLSVEHDQLSRIPWCSNGFYLSSRPSFTADPLFHAGAYYVQEASSMFLETVMKQTVNLAEPLKVLDLCAAPGGKSTLLQSVISDNSLLVSNEVIKTRVNILAENISKWGAANVVITNNDPKDFQRLQNYFDVIVVDAPCSGSGLFRKDPQAINEWSEQNVQHCSMRQQRILSDILPSLKPGGVLIYSTCSYSEMEDEEIADWLIEEFYAESLQLKIDENWGIVETRSAKQRAYGYRFYPDKVKGEGFFIAAFKKKELPGETWKEDKHKKKTEKVSLKEIDIIKPFLKAGDNFFYIRQNDAIIAVPLHIENDLAVIQATMYIKKAGVRVGTVIRNELIPDHELALSTIISSEVNSIEVDKETALQYLRRNEIKPDTDFKGWALIKYQQLPLGWIKILPGRVNNYYPKEWRILNK